MSEDKHREETKEQAAQLEKQNERLMALANSAKANRNFLEKLVAERNNNQKS